MPAAFDGEANHSRFVIPISISPIPRPPPSFVLCFAVISPL
jgi:hypothetical protein